jgi:hypothetical protein
VGVEALVGAARECASQTLGSILDGLMRNTPDAQNFIELAATHGVPAAVAARDTPFGGSVAPLLAINPIHHTSFDPSARPTVGCAASRATQ